MLGTNRARSRPSGLPPLGSLKPLPERADGDSSSHPPISSPRGFSSRGDTEGESGSSFNESVIPWLHTGDLNRKVRGYETEIRTAVTQKLLSTAKGELSKTPLLNSARPGLGGLNRFEDEDEDNDDRSKDSGQNGARPGSVTQKKARIVIGSELDEKAAKHEYMIHKKHQEILNTIATQISLENTGRLIAESARSKMTGGFVRQGSRRRSLTMNSTEGGTTEPPGSVTRGGKRGSISKGRLPGQDEGTNGDGLSVIPTNIALLDRAALGSDSTRRSSVFAEGGNGDGEANDGPNRRSSIVTKLVKVAPEHSGVALLHMPYSSLSSLALMTSSNPEGEGMSESKTEAPRKRVRKIVGDLPFTPTEEELNMLNVHAPTVEKYKQLNNIKDDIDLEEERERESEMEKRSNISLQRNGPGSSMDSAVSYYRVVRNREIEELDRAQKPSQHHPHSQPHVPSGHGGIRLASPRTSGSEANMRRRTKRRTQGEGMTEMGKAGNEESTTNQPSFPEQLGRGGDGDGHEDDEARAEETVAGDKVDRRSQGFRPTPLLAGENSDGGGELSHGPLSSGARYNKARSSMRNSQRNSHETHPSDSRPQSKEESYFGRWSPQSSSPRISASNTQNLRSPPRSVRDRSSSSSQSSPKDRGISGDGYREEVAGAGKDEIVYEGYLDESGDIVFYPEGSPLGGDRLNQRYWRREGVDMPWQEDEFEDPYNDYYYFSGDEDEDMDDFYDDSQGVYPRVEGDATSQDTPSHQSQHPLLSNPPSQISESQSQLYALVSAISRISKADPLGKGTDPQPSIQTSMTPSPPSTRSDLSSDKGSPKPFATSSSNKKTPSVAGTAYGPSEPSQSHKGTDNDDSYEIDLGRGIPKDTVRLESWLGGKHYADDMANNSIPVDEHTTTSHNAGTWSSSVLVKRPEPKRELFHVDTRMVADDSDDAYLSDEGSLDLNAVDDLSIIYSAASAAPETNADLLTTGSTSPEKQKKKKDKDQDRTTLSHKQVLREIVRESIAKDIPTSTFSQATAAVVSTVSAVLDTLEMETVEAAIQAKEAALASSSKLVATESQGEESISSASSSGLGASEPRRESGSSAGNGRITPSMLESNKQSGVLVEQNEAITTVQRKIDGLGLALSGGTDTLKRLYTESQLFTVSKLTQQRVLKRGKEMHKAAFSSPPTTPAIAISSTSGNTSTPTTSTSISPLPTNTPTTPQTPHSTNAIVETTNNVSPAGNTTSTSDLLQSQPQPQGQRQGQGQVDMTAIIARDTGILTAQLTNLRFNLEGIASVAKQVEVLGAKNLNFEVTKQRIMESGQPWRDYHEQIDQTAHEDDVIADRQALRNHPQILTRIQKIWLVFFGDVPVNPYERLTNRFKSEAPDLPIPSGLTPPLTPQPPSPSPETPSPGSSGPLTSATISKSGSRSSMSSTQTPPSGTSALVAISSPSPTRPLRPMISVTPGTPNLNSPLLDDRSPLLTGKKVAISSQIGLAKDVAELRLLLQVHAANPLLLNHYNHLHFTCAFSALYPPSSHPSIHISQLSAYAVPNNQYHDSSLTPDLQELPLSSRPVVIPLPPLFAQADPTRRAVVEPWMTFSTGGSPGIYALTDPLHLQVAQWKKEHSDSDPPSPYENTSSTRRSGGSILALRNSDGALSLTSPSSRTPSPGPSGALTLSSLHSTNTSLVPIDTLATTNPTINKRESDAFERMFSNPSSSTEQLESPAKWTGWAIQSSTSSSSSSLSLSLPSPSPTLVTSSSPLSTNRQLELRLRQRGSNLQTATNNGNAMVPVTHPYKYTSPKRLTFAMYRQLHTRMSKALLTAKECRTPYLSSPLVVDIARDEEQRDKEGRYSHLSGHSSSSSSYSTSSYSYPSTGYGGYNGSGMGNTTGMDMNNNSMHGNNRVQLPPHDVAIDMFINMSRKERVLSRQFNRLCALDWNRDIERDPNQQLDLDGTDLTELGTPLSTPRSTSPSPLRGNLRSLGSSLSRPSSRSVSPGPSSRSLSPSPSRRSITLDASATRDSLINAYGDATGAGLFNTTHRRNSSINNGYTNNTMTPTGRNRSMYSQHRLSGSGMSGQGGNGPSGSNDAGYTAGPSTLIEIEGVKVDPTATLSYEGWVQSMFEMIDIWCEGVDVYEYAAFLDILLSRLVIHTVIDARNAGDALVKATVKAEGKRGKWGEESEDRDRYSKARHVGIRDDVDDGEDSRDSTTKRVGVPKKRRSRDAMELGLRLDGDGGDGGERDDGSSDGDSDSAVGTDSGSSVESDEGDDLISTGDDDTDALGEGQGAGRREGETEEEAKKRQRKMKKRKRAAGISQMLSHLSRRERERAISVIQQQLKRMNHPSQIAAVPDQAETDREMFIDSEVDALIRKTKNTLWGSVENDNLEDASMRDYFDNLHAQALADSSAPLVAPAFPLRPISQQLQPSPTNSSSVPTTHPSSPPVTASTFLPTTANKAIGKSPGISTKSLSQVNGVNTSIDESISRPSSEDIGSRLTRSLTSSRKIKQNRKVDDTNKPKPFYSLAHVSTSPARPGDQQSSQPASTTQPTPSKRKRKVTGNERSGADGRHPNPLSIPRFQPLTMYGRRPVKDKGKDKEKGGDKMKGVDDSSPQTLAMKMLQSALNAMLPFRLGGNDAASESNATSWLTTSDNPGTTESNQNGNKHSKQLRFVDISRIGFPLSELNIKEATFLVSRARRILDSQREKEKRAAVFGLTIGNSNNTMSGSRLNSPGPDDQLMTDEGLEMRMLDTEPVLSDTEARPGSARPLDGKTREERSREGSISASGHSELESRRDSACSEGPDSTNPSNLSTSSLSSGPSTPILKANRRIIQILQSGRAETRSKRASSVLLEATLKTQQQRQKSHSILAVSTSPSNAPSPHSPSTSTQPRSRENSLSNTPSGGRSRTLTPGKRPSFTESSDQRSSPPSSTRGTPTQATRAERSRKGRGSPAPPSGRQSPHSIRDATTTKRSRGGSPQPELGDVSLDDVEYLHTLAISPDEAVLRRIKLVGQTKEVKSSQQSISSSQPQGTNPSSSDTQTTDSKPFASPGLHAMTPSPAPSGVSEDSIKATTLDTASVTAQGEVVAPKLTFLKGVVDRIAARSNKLKQVGPVTLAGYRELWKRVFASHGQEDNPSLDSSSSGTAGGNGLPTFYRSAGSNTIMAETLDFFSMLSAALGSSTKWSMKSCVQGLIDLLTTDDPPTEKLARWNALKESKRRANDYSDGDDSGDESPYNGAEEGKGKMSSRGGKHKGHGDGLDGSSPTRDTEGDDDGDDGDDDGEADMAKAERMMYDYQVRSMGDMDGDKHANRRAKLSNKAANKATKRILLPSHGSLTATTASSNGKDGPSVYRIHPDGTASKVTPYQGGAERGRGAGQPGSSSSHPTSKGSLQQKAQADDVSRHLTALAKTLTQRTLAALTHPVTTLPTNHTHSNSTKAALPPSMMMNKTGQLLHIPNRSPHLSTNTPAHAHGAVTHRSGGAVSTPIPPPRPVEPTYMSIGRIYQDVSLSSSTMQSMSKGFLMDTMSKPPTATPLAMTSPSTSTTPAISASLHPSSSSMPSSSSLFSPSFSSPFSPSPLLHPWQKHPFLPFSQPVAPPTMTFPSPANPLPAPTQPPQLIPTTTSVVTADPPASVTPTSSALSHAASILELRKLIRFHSHVSCRPIVARGWPVSSNPPLAQHETNNKQLSQRHPNKRSSTSTSNTNMTSFISALPLPFDIRAFITQYQTTRKPSSSVPLLPLFTAPSSTSPVASVLVNPSIVISLATEANLLPSALISKQNQEKSSGITLDPTLVPTRPPHDTSYEYMTRSLLSLLSPWSQLLFSPITPPVHEAHIRTDTGSSKRRPASTSSTILVAAFYAITKPTHTGWNSSHTSATNNSVNDSHTHELRHDNTSHDPVSRQATLPQKRHLNCFHFTKEIESDDTGLFVPVEVTSPQTLPNQQDHPSSSSQSSPAVIPSPGTSLQPLVGATAVSSQPRRYALVWFDGRSHDTTGNNSNNNTNHNLDLPTTTSAPGDGIDDWMHDPRLRNIDALRMNDDVIENRLDSKGRVVTQTPREILHRLVWKYNRRRKAGQTGDEKSKKSSRPTNNANHDATLTPSEKHPCEEHDRMMSPIQSSALVIQLMTMRWAVLSAISKEDATSYSPQNNHKPENNTEGLHKLETTNPKPTSSNDESNDKGINMAKTTGEQPSSIKDNPSLTNLLALLISHKRRLCQSTPPASTSSSLSSSSSVGIQQSNHSQDYSVSSPPSSASSNSGEPTYDAIECALLLYAHHTSKLFRNLATSIKNHYASLLKFSKDAGISPSTYTSSASSLSSSLSGGTPDHPTARSTTSSQSILTNLPSVCFAASRCVFLCHFLIAHMTQLKKTIEGIVAIHQSLQEELNQVKLNSSQDDGPKTNPTQEKGGQGGDSNRDLSPQHAHSMQGQSTPSSPPSSTMTSTLSSSQALPEQGNAQSRPWYNTVTFRYTQVDPFLGTSTMCLDRLSLPPSNVLLNPVRLLIHLTTTFPHALHALATFIPSQTLIQQRLQPRPSLLPGSFFPRQSHIYPSSLPPHWKYPMLFPVPPVLPTRSTYTDIISAIEDLKRRVIKPSHPYKMRMGQHLGQANGEGAVYSSSNSTHKGGTVHGNSKPMSNGYGLTPEQFAAEVEKLKHKLGGKAIRIRLHALPQSDRYGTKASNPRTNQLESTKATTPSPQLDLRITSLTTRASFYPAPRPSIINPIPTHPLTSTPTLASAITVPTLSQSLSIPLPKGSPLSIDPSLTPHGSLVGTTLSSHAKYRDGISLDAPSTHSSDGQAPHTFDRSVSRASPSPPVPSSSPSPPFSSETFNETASVGTETPTYVSHIMEPNQYHCMSHDHTDPATLLPTLSPLLLNAYTHVLTLCSPPQSDIGGLSSRLMALNRLGEYSLSVFTLLSTIQKGSDPKSLENETGTRDPLAPIPMNQLVLKATGGKDMTNPVHTRLFKESKLRTQPKLIKGADETARLAAIATKTVLETSVKTNSASLSKPSTCDNPLDTPPTTATTTSPGPSASSLSSSSSSVIPPSHSVHQAKVTTGSDNRMKLSDVIIPGIVGHSHIPPAFLSPSDLRVHPPLRHRSETSATARLSSTSSRPNTSTDPLSTTLPLPQLPPGPSILGVPPISISKGSLTSRILPHHLIRDTNALPRAQTARAEYAYRAYADHAAKLSYDLVSEASAGLYSKSGKNQVSEPNSKNSDSGVFHSEEDPSSHRGRVIKGPTSHHANSAPSISSSSQPYQGTDVHGRPATSSLSQLGRLYPQGPSGTKPGTPSSSLSLSLRSVRPPSSARGATENGGGVSGGVGGGLFASAISDRAMLFANTPADRPRKYFSSTNPSIDGIYPSTVAHDGSLLSDSSSMSTLGRPMTTSALNNARGRGGSTKRQILSTTFAASTTERRTKGLMRVEGLLSTSGRNEGGGRADKYAVQLQHIQVKLAADAELSSHHPSSRESSEAPSTPLGIPPSHINPVSGMRPWGLQMEQSGRKLQDAANRGGLVNPYYVLNQRQDKVKRKTGNEGEDGSEQEGWEERDANAEGKGNEENEDDEEETDDDDDDDDDDVIGLPLSDSHLDQLIIPLPASHRRLTSPKHEKVKGNTKGNMTKQGSRDTPGVTATPSTTLLPSSKKEGRKGTAGGVSNLHGAHRTGVARIDELIERSTKRREAERRTKAERSRVVSEWEAESDERFLARTKAPKIETHMHMVSKSQGHGP